MMASRRPRTGRLPVALLAACAAACGPGGGDGDSRPGLPTPDDEPRIQRVLDGLRAEVAVRGRPAPETRSLAEAMVDLAVPGVSVAVVDGGELAWARGWGVQEAGADEPVTPGTLFQAASISKPVAATGLLRLVEDGLLELDAPVNDALTSWQLPENGLTRREPVTLRRILSHSAGLTVWGFPGYRAGREVPTVPQVLDGAPPANTPAVRVERVPGSGWLYSGGGVTIAQLAMGDATGEPFPELMERLVLGPVGMDDSTFEQPLPERLASEAAVAHDRDGDPVEGRWHTYPEMAAAGLWTTPTDLMRWAMALAAAWRGERGGVLPPERVREMLTVQAGSHGLGPSVHGRGDGLRFGHGGANAGFRGQVVYFPRTGQGAAVLSNGDGGGRLNREILLAVGAEYGWPGYAEVVPPPAPVDPGDYVGDYATPVPPLRLALRVRDGRLHSEADGPLPSEEIALTGADRGVGLISGNAYEFLRRAGRVRGLRTAGLELARR